MPQTNPPNVTTAMPAVQIGPPYHCFQCGAPARGLQPWLACNSPLDAWQDHLGYLLCACKCNHRVARLQDCVTPLVFAEAGDCADWRGLVAANIAALKSALAALANSVPETARQRDSPTSIVYQVLAGTLPPNEAIDQIRGLTKGSESFRARTMPDPIVGRQGKP